jgi:hypothetical protein
VATSEEGLEFWSEADISMGPPINNIAFIVILKTVECFKLTLIDVQVTGTSRGRVTWHRTTVASVRWPNASNGAGLQR